MLSSIMVKLSVCLQFQLLVLGQLTSGFIYGPSLEYLTGSGDESLVQRRTVNLADYASSGFSVLVPLAENKSTAQPWEVKPVGEFSVIAPENMRIMAIVQGMHLRTKSVTSAFPPVCRDYIIFGEESISKICGDVQKTDKKGAPTGMMGARTFLSHHNFLNVTVYTDVSTYIEMLMKKPNMIEISFTAYQTCPFYDPDEVFLNCLDKIIPYGPSCISANLTCDGVLNCGFLTEGTFSKDETNCPSQFPEFPVPTTMIPGQAPPVALIPSSSHPNRNPDQNHSPSGSDITGFAPSTTTHAPPKTGFPSWWDWEERKHNRANDINSHSHLYFGGKSNTPHSNIDFSNIHFPKSEVKTGFEQFAPYIAIFVILWVLLVFAKISRCFFLGPKPASLMNEVYSTSNLMQTPSSASLSSSAAPTSGLVFQESHHRLPSASYAIQPVAYSSIEEPPPSYASLFKDSEITSFSVNPTSSTNPDPLSAPSASSTAPTLVIPPPVSSPTNNDTTTTESR